MAFLNRRLHPDSNSGGGAGIDPNKDTDPNKETDPNKDKDVDPNKDTDPNKETDPDKDKDKPVMFSQEQLDAIVKKEKAKLKTKIAELEGRVSGFADLEGKVKAYETQIEGFKDFDVFKTENEKYKTTITNMLNKRVENVPEDYRDLIPNNLGEIEKLEWIDNAFAKGLFGKGLQQFNTGSNGGGDKKEISVKSTSMSDLFKEIGSK